MMDDASLTPFIRLVVFGYRYSGVVMQRGAAKRCYPTAQKRLFKRAVLNNAKFVDVGND
jgi:hypothetical protein